jgi:hypothetical protein
VLKWNFTPNNWRISTVIMKLPKMNTMEYAMAGITTYARFANKRGWKNSGQLQQSRVNAFEVEILLFEV